MTDDTDDTGKPLRAEFLQMMQRCSEEIKMLRAHIARLEPKAAAYDDLSRVLSLLPRPSQGEGEDLVWRLEKRMAELIKPVSEANAIDHHQA